MTRVYIYSVESRHYVAQTLEKYLDGNIYGFYSIEDIEGLKNDFANHSVELTEEEESLKNRYEAILSEFEAMCARKIAQKLRPELYELLCRIHAEFVKYGILEAKGRDEFACLVIKNINTSWRVPLGKYGDKFEGVFRFWQSSSGFIFKNHFLRFCLHLPDGASVDTNRRVGLLNKALHSFEGEFKKLYYKK